MGLMNEQIRAWCKLFGHLYIVADAILCWIETPSLGCRWRKLLRGKAGMCASTCDEENVAFKISKRYLIIYWIENLTSAIAMIYTKVGTVRLFCWCSRVAHWNPTSNTRLPVSPAAGESLQSWAAGAEGLLPCCTNDLIVAHSHSWSDRKEPSKVAWDVHFQDSNVSFCWGSPPTLIFLVNVCMLTDAVILLANAIHVWFRSFVLGPWKISWRTHGSSDWLSTLISTEVKHFNSLFVW